jgi:phosphomannomutase
MSEDPDPLTRAELAALIEADDVAELSDRFAGFLRFGTAGLRGPRGAGPNRMNRVVVMRAAAGVAAWLQEHHEDPAVVVGFDARHQSAEFAADAAAVLAGAGVRVTLMDAPRPTPVLAFAVGHLGVDAGLMLTASHNRAADSGLKVYLGDTAQIADPVDAEMAAAIATVGAISALPKSESYARVGDELLASYVDAVARHITGAGELSVVYTALHGVGHDAFHRVSERCGFTFTAVPEQCAPDPDFPTVAFPNPEEPGAMDAALALGERRSADIVLAHDPDADRCALAARNGTQLTVLTGDQLGVLLADAHLRHGVSGCYASTIVSSELLGKMAAAHGQRWQQTLTGFKWVGRIPDLAFGYEEALGYCVSPAVSRDKDGIAAAVAAVELVAELRSRGMTVFDRLEEIYREHGHHLTGQLALRFERAAEIVELMHRLRTAPPRSLGPHPVTSLDDFAEGYRDLPQTDALRLGLACGRVIIRPSGTEPKVKCYVEVIADDRGRAQEQLDSVLDQLSGAMTIGSNR